MHNIINEIKEIIEKPVDPSLFPLKKGNRILLGNFTVFQKKSGYEIKNREKRTVAFTETKLAAVAAAKTLNKSNHYLLEILRLDRLIAKNLTDCVFYENKFRNTKKDEVKECAFIRYEDSRAHVKEARDKLNSFIYPKMVNNTVSNKGRE